MYPTPDLAAFVQRDRERSVTESRLARIAAAARACCAAPVSFIQRIVRLARPVPQSC